ncbi:MAG: hypothetical protein B6I38_01255 [Anaerolineaceae bacterium 4572_5.1]|nr:MAG: hypothetical protein B6I38_01255 [Anaerolineaceae bacterium 4572_5.1]RLD10238.1 MAG: hypothetical protein DRI56_02980 [Chloroflexota bacterium]
MFLTPTFMRWALFICIAAMDILTAFYLRRRKLSPRAYLGWGLLALFLPIIGPILVILSQPGQAREY